jgi:hypothetical protein
VLDCRDSKAREGLVVKDEVLKSIVFADTESQVLVLDEFMELCSRLLKRGLRLCPKEIGGLFQSYAELWVAPQESKLSILFRGLCADAEFSSTLVPCLIKQGQYIGEVSGMIQILSEGEQKFWFKFRGFGRRSQRRTPEIIRQDLQDTPGDYKVFHTDS